MMRRSLLFCAILMILVVAASAQTPTPAGARNLTLDAGVAAHKGLDEVYRVFGEGYRKLDPAMVAGLYTESAAYLAPGGEVQTGRRSILGSFTGFFDTVRRTNSKAEISFRIIQREVDSKLAYDVGIYTLTLTDAGGRAQRSSGKFVVVAKLGPDNAWRFQVDAYNDLPNATKQSIASRRPIRAAPRRIADQIAAPSRSHPSARSALHAPPPATARYKNTKQ